MSKNIWIKTRKPGNVLHTSSGYEKENGIVYFNVNVTQNIFQKNDS